MSVRIASLPGIGVGTANGAAYIYCTHLDSGKLSGVWTDDASWGKEIDNEFFPNPQWGLAYVWNQWGLYAVRFQMWIPTVALALLSLWLWRRRRRRGGGKGFEVQATKEPR